MRRKEFTIPTLVGLFVAIVGLASGLFLVKSQMRQAAKAAEDEAPQNVKVSNVTDASFTVSWTSTKSLSGYVQYGENDNPDLVVSDERDQQRGSIGNYFTHFITVRGLRPQTRYQFLIGSGTSLFGQNGLGGQNYQLTTGPTLTNPPAADVAYGMVVASNNEPADGAIVYMEMPGMAPQSGLVRASGSWVLPISTSRSTDLGKYVTYDKETSQFNLTVQGGPLGVANAKVNTKNDSPVPQISLGQSYTFTAVGQQAVESKFRGVGGEEPDTGPLKILAPKSNDLVNTNRPEIIGEAPAGTQVEIEINSEAKYTGAAVAGSDGKFNFSVPGDLEPGEHTVTVSAIVDGITKRITRSFTVYAQGQSSVPFYSATPSASLAPTPTNKVVPTTSLSPTPRVTVFPSSTPKVTPIATASGTIKPTPSPTLPPRTTNPSTDSALPRSGNEMFTIILLLAGGALVAGGGVWYRQTVRA